MTRYCYKEQTFWWPSSYISPKSPTDTFSSMIISLLWPRLFSIGRKVSLQKVSNLIIDKLFERLRSMSTLQCQIWKWNQNFIFSLPHFMPLISFYAPWKHQTTFCFLTFLGGIKRVHDLKRVNSEQIFIFQTILPIFLFKHMPIKLDWYGRKGWDHSLRTQNFPKN